ncbi:MAG TPA: DnaA/Hda family protein [Phycisphaerales bacterium]
MPTTTSGNSVQDHGAAGAPSGRIERHARPRLAPDRVAADRIAPAGDAVRERFVSELRRLGSLPAVERYLTEARAIRIDGGTLEILVTSKFVAELLQRRGGEACLAAARALLGAQAQLRIRVDPATARVSLPGAATGSASVSPGTVSGSANGAVSGSAPVVRGPDPAPKPRGAVSRHRLEDFIVGASNRLAYSAAVRLADGAQADSISPLFLHAPCGMGKTHLLQGIAARFGEKHPGSSVRCLTAEAFTNEFIAALKGGSIEGFRRSYRRVALLCIDDVHFLSSKDATQTELLHTLDAIAHGGAKIVLASDEHPREIRKLSSALSSRFMSGAVLRIEEPDEALRRALSEQLARRRGLSLDESGVGALAAASWRSVRELEGVLTQVIAAVRLLPELASLDALSATQVRRAIEMAGGSRPLALATGGPGARSRRPVPMSVILAEVARALCVDQSEMAGTGRHRRVVLARSIGVYLARRLTTLSFPEIARAMGRPNHSSVITAHNRLLALLQAAEACELGGAESEELLLTHADLRAIGLSASLREFCRVVEAGAIEAAEKL